MARASKPGCTEPFSFRGALEGVIVSVTLAGDLGRLSEWCTDTWSLGHGPKKTLRTTGVDFRYDSIWLGEGMT
jgi:hypothetical protein